MFHWRDGWTFIREHDGFVHVWNDDDLVMVIPPNEWKSIVDALSEKETAF